MCVTYVRDEQSTYGASPSLPPVIDLGLVIQAQQKQVKVVAHCRRKVSSILPPGPVDFLHLDFAVLSVLCQFKILYLAFLFGFWKT